MLTSRALFNILDLEHFLAFHCTALVIIHMQKGTGHRCEGILNILLPEMRVQLIYVMVLWFKYNYVICVVIIWNVLFNFLGLLVNRKKKILNIKCLVWVRRSFQRRRPTFIEKTVYTNIIKSIVCLMLIFRKRL